MAPRRRKYTRKRRARKGRRISKAFTAKVKKVMTRVVERKVRVTAATVSPTSTPSILLMNGVPQGDGRQNRDGDMINEYSLVLTGAISWAASDNNAGFRLVVVRDHQQVADSPPLAMDVFGIGTPSIFAQLSVTSAGRFSIVADRIVYQHTNMERVRLRPIYLRIRQKVKYNGSLDGDIQKNGLYLFIWSTQVSPDEPAFSYEQMFRYTDP